MTDDSHGRSLLRHQEPVAFREQTFIHLAAYAAFGTALTTIGVHYVSFPAETFEQRLDLATNGWYTAHRWMIILHCLMVIVSMLGIALVTFQKSRGLTILGLLGFTVFGVTEIVRMFSVLEYLNPLRMEYLATTDESTRMILKYNIDHFQLAGNTLFAVFVFAFTLGNLCYGLILKNENGWTRWIGIGFLYWACIGITGMVNDALQWSAINSIGEWNGKIFQPVFRCYVGIWIIRSYGKVK